MGMKKYWKEVLFFGIIVAVYVQGVAPDMTWMSLGADGVDYTVAACDLYASC